MPLLSTTASSLREHLDQLGVQAGDSLCVHSHLLSLGMLEGGVNMVADVLLETLGPKGTLIVPTYTLDKADMPFDIAKTQSHNVGALSEYIRNLPNAIRSASPMHSHAAVGKQANCLLKSDSTTSFGPQSDFAQFDAIGAKLLLLGCDFQQGGTYLHQMETLSGVPYREWVTVEREIVGTVQPMQCRYYGRKATQPMRNDFSSLQLIALERGLAKAVAAPYGQSYAMALGDLHKLATEMLEANSYALVAHG